MSDHCPATPEATEELMRVIGEAALAEEPLILDSGQVHVLGHLCHETLDLGRRAMAMARLVTAERERADAAESHAADLGEKLKAARAGRA